MPRQRKIDDMWWIRFEEMRSQGYSIRAIAREFGVAHSTLIRGYRRFENITDGRARSSEIFREVHKVLLDGLNRAICSERVLQICREVKARHAVVMTSRRSRLLRHCMFELTKLAIELEEEAFTGMGRLKAREHVCSMAHLAAVSSIPTT